MIRLDPPSPEKTPSPGDRRLSTYSLLLLTKKKVARQWYTLPVGDRWVNSLPDEASRAKWERFLLKRYICHRPEKKTHFVGLFFLTGLRPVLRLRRSTPSARCAFGAPPSQLDRPCAPPGVPRTTGSTLRLSTYSLVDQRIWTIDR